MGSVGRKAEHDNLVLLCVLQKLIGIMRLMAIYNQETVVVSCLGLRLSIEDCLDPLASNNIVGVAFLGGAETSEWY